MSSIRLEGAQDQMCETRNLVRQAPEMQRRHRTNTVHEGKLELITWSGESEGYALGWGASFEEESEDPRNMFEERFRGDVQRFYAYRPQAFRWTCCGTSASMDYGCDHHGAGSQPCTCDFCRHVNSNRSVCIVVPLTCFSF